MLKNVDVKKPLAVATEEKIRRGGAGMFKNVDEFKEALTVATEEVKEELQVDLEELWDSIWKRITVERLFDEDDVVHMLEFRSRIEKELESRKWSIYKFRNEKNETILNVFKKVLKQIVKEEKKELNNDVLSRILNTVRTHYGGAKGIMTAALYPPKAFSKRSYYNIPDDLGDERSCFHEGGRNRGNLFWLIQEYEKYKRAFFVVFRYEKERDKEVGYGRCWVYKVGKSLLATNFYSDGVELKSEGFRYVIVRLLQKLFNMNEYVKFELVESEWILPIFLNKDAIIIYDPSVYASVDEVIGAIYELDSICLMCNLKTKVKNLVNCSREVKYKDEFVEGLIVCESCEEGLDRKEICSECERLVCEEDGIWIEEEESFVCRKCFERYWVICDNCGEYTRKEVSCKTRDKKILCWTCSVELDAECV